MTQADFDITHHGSVVSFTPLTEAARAWTQEFVHLESWQWDGPTFVVDWRFAEPLREGILDDGLVIQ